MTLTKWMNEMLLPAAFFNGACLLLFWIAGSLSAAVMHRPFRVTLTADVAGLLGWTAVLGASLLDVVFRERRR